MIGAVTSEIIRTRSVVAATPPRTDHAYGEWPCEYSHGWKWSEIVTKSNPAASARFACSTSARGSWSSHMREKPNAVMAPPYPAYSVAMSEKHPRVKRD